MIHFFGDSWVAENGEIEFILRKQNKSIDHCKSFPTMVGERLNCEIVNYGESGSCQMSMLYKLQSANLNNDDIAIFCLTAPARRFYFDFKNEVHNMFIDTNKEYTNDNQDTWISAVTLFAIKSYCDIKNVKSYFVCMFNKSYFKNTKINLWQDIKNFNWILPPETCVVRELFDPKWFTQYKEYANSDYVEWLQTENQNVNKYIRPCIDHPNLEGRGAIAELIVQTLKKRIKNECT
jgi:hypothetical protein